MNKAWPALASLVAVPFGSLALAGCDHRPATPPLAGARLGGPFTLTDQDGHAFSSRALAGRYPVIYFGYTFCPDVCPMDLAVLGKGLNAFAAEDPARAARVQPLFVTVDPARDTPAVLKPFVAAFHPRLIGLTGSAAAIAAVARAYGASGRIMPAAKGAAGYLVEHSRMAVLFGPDGAPIALVPVDADAAAVARTLATWVR